MRELIMAGLIIGTTLMPEHASAQTVGATWTLTGEMKTPRYDHTATLLRDGRILVAGGAGPGTCSGPSTNSSELFDPVRETWSATGNLNTARSKHTATLLQNGEVLVAGGITDNSAELYDPATGMWRLTGSFNAILKNVSATLLPDGNVLALGASSTGLISAELYDPATGAWSSVAAPNFGTSAAHIVLVAGGKVLAVAEGAPWDYDNLDAELYDPATGQWLTAGHLNIWWAQTVTLLHDGKVLVTGVHGANNTTQAELYDPFSGTWSITGHPSTYRHYGGYTATLLGNGQVLVAGGVDYSSQQPVTAEELYNPGTGEWSLTSRLLKTRNSHTATLLRNGVLLVAGGVDGLSCDGATLGSAELYDPRTSTDPIDHLGTWILRNSDLNVSGVSEVALDPANPSLMYAAATKGVFKTTDGGGTWAQSGDLENALAVAMDPHNPSIVFASSYESARKTTDGGATWTEVRPNPARLSGAKAIAIDPSNPSTVYAVLVTDGTRDDRYTGLSKSTDGGSTFSYINSGLPFSYFYYGFDTSALAIDPSAPSNLFAYSIGMAKSTDGGASWSRVNSDFPYYVAALAVDPSQSSFVYAATQQRGLLRSSDGGTTWEEHLNGLPTGWAGGLTDVIVDPLNSTTVYVSTEDSGVYKSIDRGQHFTTFSEGLPPIPIHALAIDSTGTFLAAATDRGVFTFSPPRRRAIRP